METLSTVAAAAHNCERLRFGYASHDGTVSERDVEPHTLVYTGRRWYLLAWDTDRRDWRTFRADRITLLPPSTAVASFGDKSAAARPRFVPREPPGGDAAAHVLRGTVSAPWPYKVRVILRAPASAVAERTTPTSGRVTDLGDGTCELVTGYDSLADLATYLSGFEVPFTVLEPPELRAFLRERAQRYLDASS